MSPAQSIIRRIFLHIQGAVRGQGSDDHAVDAQAAEQVDLPAHLVHLGIGIQKVAEAGADENVHRDGAVPQDLLKHGRRGGDAADDQLAAELQTVCAAPAGGQSGGIGIHAAFNQGGAGSGGCHVGCPPLGGEIGGGDQAFSSSRAR